MIAFVGGTTTRPAGAAVRCTPGASWAYARGVGAATRSKRDAWGDKLLAARNGPTYAAAAKLLAPLVYATQRGRRPLTRSGVYYLPLAYPTDVYAPTTFALHVADGSQIITRRNDGPNLTIFVGRTGRERYGSCLARTTLATLADGYLPIIETAYTDANGVDYTQESFAGRVAGARSIVSFVHLTVDTTEAKTGAVVRFAASDPKRLLVADRAPVHVARGETADLYTGWVNQLPLLQPVQVNDRTYDRARAGIVDYWNERLARGAQIVVPEQRVMDAERAILMQQLVQTWRYSVGNPYEELSFAEALDTAQVMAEYGYPTTADGILRIALDRLPKRFSSWRAGELLLAAAVNYDLYRDRKALTRETPDLATTVATLAGRQLTDGDAAGRLQPEPLSSDVPGAVDGVPAQVVAWQGLAAISRVWSVTGHPELAARAGTIALRLERALRPAVRKVEVRMPDRSLFLPATLTDPSRPYPRITSTRDGSYWNLVMPYAFASGFFAPGGGEAKGILRYLSLHGSRFAGVTRADAHIAYGRYIVGDGLGEVYVLNQSRFLADNDQPDQLTLTLYGMLAAGMTRDTYVSGEAVSLLPVGTSYYRTMYMPPNLGANSSFLETLKLLLVHERRGPRGAPRGLDLAFSTPRAWLLDGATIDVRRVRTSFGPLSFSMQRTGRTIRIDVSNPKAPEPARLRLRLPAGTQLLRVRIGSRRLHVDRRTMTVTLPARVGRLRLVATLR
ncbi:MAG TPA: hypothetical protein VLJ44_08280 [Gaiellaceae bacterium]|nr:hypothetical protein [Gaiellaceae bacterium]